MNEVETYAERIVNENMHVIGNLKPFPDESCVRYKYIIIDTEDLQDAGYETSEAYPKKIANAREDINAVFVARELPYKATVKSVNVIAVFRCDESNANIIEIQKNIETGYGDDEEGLMLKMVERIDLDEYDAGDIEEFINVMFETLNLSYVAEYDFDSDILSIKRN